MAKGIRPITNLIAPCVTFRLPIGVKDILAIIDDALVRKGLSAAAASRLAVGNPSLIKNMRSEAGTGKRFNAGALQRLAAMLDLEFYFGEPREETSLSLPGGFAERTVEPLSSSLARREALEMGFLPIPYHSAAAPDFRGTAPVALARQWLAVSGLAAADLAFLPVLTADMAPTLAVGALALVDVSRKSFTEGGIVAVSHAGRHFFARVQQPSSDMMVMAFDKLEKPVQVLKGSDLQAIRILGRVVWIAQHP